MSIGRKKLLVCEKNVTAFSCCGKNKNINHINFKVFKHNSISLLTRKCMNSLPAQQCQVMPGDTCDHTCACLQTCKIPSTSEETPRPTSLSTVQLHKPNRIYVPKTARLVNFTFITLLYPVL